MTKQAKQEIRYEILIDQRNQGVYEVPFDKQLLNYTSRKEVVWFLTAHYSFKSHLKRLCESIDVKKQIV